MAGLYCGQIPVERILIPPGAPDPLRFAAEELQRYLQRALGHRCEVGEGRPGPGMFFITTPSLSPEAPTPESGSLTGKHDRSAIVTGSGCVWMVGENDRSALYAVYDFLKDRLGVRFFGPGPEHEYVPAHDEARLIEGFALYTGSAFEFRDYNVNKNPVTVDYVVKNRLNSIVTHYTDDTLRAIRQRGVLLRGPGHCWSHFLPEATLFDKHPEYFPCIDGKRTAEGTITACFSHPDVWRIFFEKFRAFVRARPHYDIFAFWAEDVNVPYYCGCPECARRSVSDWYLLLVNEAARILDEERPEALFEFIAYHETRTPPVEVKTLYRDGETMLLNLCLGYSRDLYHPLAEGRYGSAEVLRMYRDWLGYLREVGYRGKRFLMEYYNLCEGPNHGPRGRALLWPMQVIREDTLFYLRDRIDGLGAWICQDRPCFPSPFNVWCWLSLYSRPETEIADLEEDFYPAYFGPAGPRLRDYMHRLETTMHEQATADNMEKLERLVDDLAGLPCAAEPFRHRIEVVKVHHAYCLLLKEIHRAVLDRDAARVDNFIQVHDGFMDHHRTLLEGEIDIPVIFWDMFTRGWIRNQGLERTAELLADPMIH